MTDINLRKIQLLNVSAAYAVIETCEKRVSRLEKYEQDLSMELLAPLVDSLSFKGKATKDTNQLRRDILKSKLPTKMKQLIKHVLAESEPLPGNNLNKRISQINNVKSALAKPAFRPNQNIGMCNKSQSPTTPPAIITSNQKMDIPPEGIWKQAESETSRAIAGTTENKLSNFW